MEQKIQLYMKIKLIYNRKRYKKENHIMKGVACD